MRPGTTYRGGDGSQRSFSRDDLAAHALGTNNAIGAGVGIPILGMHAALGADDKATGQFNESHGRGWVEEIKIEADGSLSPVFNVTDTAAAERIASGTTRFTSAETRANYRDFGNVFRHIALTPTPRLPHQGRFEPVEGAAQFAVTSDPTDSVQFGENKMPDPEKLEDKEPADDAVDENPLADNLETNDVVSDAGPDITAMMSQVAQQHSLTLPDGVSLASCDEMTKNGLAILFTALMNAGSQAAPEPLGESTPTELGAEEGRAMGQFSEDELAALPECVREALEAGKEAQDKLQQFSEDAAAARIQTTKDTESSTLAAIGIPKGLKDRLRERQESQQFDEDGGAACITPLEAAMMFAEAVPHLPTPDDVTEPKHPEQAHFAETDGSGTTTVTEEDAEEIAAGFLERTGRTPRAGLTATNVGDELPGKPRRSKK